MDNSNNIRYNSNSDIQIHLPFFRFHFHVISNPIHWSIAAHFPQIWSWEIFCQFCYPMKVHVFGSGFILKDKMQNFLSLHHILNHNTKCNASGCSNEQMFLFCGSFNDAISNLNCTEMNEDNCYAIKCLYCFRAKITYLISWHSHTCF